MPAKKTTTAKAAAKTPAKPLSAAAKGTMNAMREAGIPYQYQSAFELTFECAKKLLEG